MNVLALKHERKTALKQRADREHQEIVDRAVKRAFMPVDITLTTGQQIRALEKYVGDLRVIAEELESEFGRDAENALRRVSGEIRQAILSIARLRMEQVKPG